MTAYKWIICIVLIVAIGIGVFYFGDFRSDESTLQQTVSATPVSSETVTAFTFSPQAYCADLLQILNAYRVKNGLSAWTQDETLTSAAATRSHECCLLQSKSHTRSDGSPWYTALNIQDNYNYSEITGIGTQSAADMARSWVAGESVNAGLLDAEYTACGLACEAAGSDVYVVLILYRP